MTIGIVGLGLIGGSFARAFSGSGASHKTLAFDISENALLEAKMAGAVGGVLSAENLHLCDYVIVAVSPSAAAAYIKENAAFFKKGGVVVDCCGVKRGICAEIAPVAKEHGFFFIGGHPMAGTQFWGFKHSRDSLFKGASMLLTPPDYAGADVLERCKKFFLSLGFGEVVFTTPEEHDRLIAFTSQLPHVVSSAYIKSRAAAEHRGFSAGSYKDLSRVAKLNENMWSELFLSNADNLTFELESLIDRLTDYLEAIKANDPDKLRLLLKEGRELKEKIEKSKVEKV